MNKSEIPFQKYHGLGNDYIVIDQRAISTEINPSLVVSICNRNFGLGSDGIVLITGRSEDLSLGSVFDIRIFNPDGSEAENSGNGTRIVSRALFDLGDVTNLPFHLRVNKARIMRSQILGNGGQVSVQMGKAVFDSEIIPVLGPVREVLNEKITVCGEDLIYSCANVGNPHTVFFCDREVDLIAAAKKFGPVVEIHERLPNHTNAQFARVVSPSEIEIAIWERGAGYTLASGSSACAVASVAFKLGYCSSEVVVRMPGGSLLVQVDANFQITQTGPVVKIAEGQISAESY